MKKEKPRVLVVGIYLANQKNTVDHLVHEFDKTTHYEIKQQWFALNGDAPSSRVKEVTASRFDISVPKFVLINQLLADELLAAYDFVILCDDDIMLPKHFLDEFLALQDKYNLSLAQPARTHSSYIDHPIVEQVDIARARWTRFVEIGPLVSLRREAVPLLVPFDESSPMGWGLDFVWPVIMEQNGLRMGIVDATPVDHSLRKPVANYSYIEARAAMDRYLSERQHLTSDEAFHVREAYR